MKTNIFKIGIAIIIAITCSISLICMDKSSDDFQSSDDYNKVFKMTTDSGWVQKDGYLENALQVGSISYFRYSNDGQYLFTFGSDYTFRKWDVKTGKVVKEKKFDIPFEITYFDMSFDGDLIALNYLALYDLGTTDIYFKDSLVCKITTNSYYQVPEQVIESGIISVFYNNKKEIITSLRLERETRWGGNNIFKNNIWIIDSCKSNDYLEEFSSNKFVMSEDDSYLLISGDDFFSDGVEHSIDYYYNLYLYDLKDDTKINILQTKNDGRFHSLAFSNSNEYITATNYTYNTLLWDINKRSLKYQINIPNLAFTQFSIDDRFLIAVQELNKENKAFLRFFESQSGTQVDSITFKDKANNGLIAVSPDSITIAVAGKDGIIRIFQPKILKISFKTAFSADTTIRQLGTPIKFFDNSIPNATSWQWDFGDGETSTKQNPVHYFKEKGAYSVKLISSNGYYTDSVLLKDYILMRIPVNADFEIHPIRDTIPYFGQMINLSTGDITSYNWTFEYKNSSNDKNPTISYDKWGKYDVSLTIKDGFFSSTKSIKDFIYAIPPAIPFFTNKFENFYDEDNKLIKYIDGISVYDGGFIYKGNVYDTIYYDENYSEIEYSHTILIKSDSLGKIQWKKFLTNDLNKLIQTPDSCFLGISSIWTDRYIFCISKYDINGELIWEKSYFNQGNDHPRNIYLTEDGGFILIGVSEYYQKYRTPVLKIDKDGNAIWYKLFGGVGGNVLNAGDGDFLLVLKDTKNTDIILNKINKDGKILWTKQYGTDTNMLSYDALAIKNEEYVIAGGIGNNGISTTYFLKVDSLGEKIYEYIGTTPNSCYYSISSISDTLFAASGNFNNQLGVDIINNQGELVNSVRFPERNGVINSIITTKDNDLFLTGSITPPYKLSQLYTLLLKHPYIITSVEDQQTENIANPEQPFNIFPNPTNSTATLQYKIETPTHLKIELINFIGMKVCELENAFKEAGKYNSLINFENLAIAKGIYFVRFIANGNIFVSKVIFY